MADSDGQVVIDLSLRKDGIQSDIQWLTDNLKNIGANVSADQISEKFENAMNDAKGTVKDAINDINGEKAEPKIGANDEQLKDKAEESKEQLDSIGNRKVSAKIKADAANLLEKAEQSDKALDKIPKSVKSEIIAQANDAGIINFEKILDKIPKSIKTELIADVRDGKAIDFEETLRKIPKEKATTLKVNDEATEPVRRYTSSVSQANEKTHTLRDVMMGTFVGGLVQSGISAITNGLHAMTQAGEEYNVQQDTMKINWENLTREAPQDGKNMVSMINDFAQKSIYSSECLDKMAQSFYHVHSNAQETKRWTQDFVNLGSTLHVSNDALAEAAEQFAKIEAGGKANAEDMQVMINRFPMFGEALEKATGKSMQQLYQLSAQGKLTADVFTKAMDELGTKYKSSQSEAMTSFQGMSMHLKSQFSMLSGDIMKSSFNMSKSTLAAIQQITDDKSMQQYANMISQAFANVMSGVSKVILYVSEHKDDIMGVIKSIASITGTIGGAVWDTFKSVISGIASAFNSLSGNASKSNDPLKNVSNALKEIASHKQALKDIGTILASIFVTKKISGFIIGLTSFVAKAKEVTGIVDGLKATFAMLGGPIGIAVAAIAGLTVAFVGLYKNNPKFKAFVDGIGKSISTLIGNITKVAKSLTKDFVGAFNKLAAPVKKAFSDIMKYIQPDLKNMQKGISSAMSTIQKVWNTTWKGIQKVVTPILNTISKFVNSHMTQIRNIIDSVVKVISTIWNTIWKQVENVFKLVWDTIFHKARVADDIKRIIQTSIKATETIWKNVWSAIKNCFDIVWDAIKNIARTAINWVKDIISNTIKTIQNIWNKIWKTISDFFGDIWDGIKKIVSNAINAVHDTISNILGKIGDVWHSMWQSFSDFFGGIWKDIKKAAQDGINGVLHVINAGIDGIDAVWKFFTGHETSIHHLKPVHFSQGGIVDRHLSMVNDGDGEDWKELIETPKGELMMSNERNAVLPLEPGTRVYNGAETRQIMSMLGVDHYANGGVVGNIQRFKDGGVVGDLIDWGAHELKDFGSWIKDKWDAITKFLKHPLENTKAIISKAITGPLSKLKSSNMVDLGKGVFDKLTKPISDWFKKGLEEAKKKHDEEVEYGKGYFNGGAGVARWGDVIDKAAKEMGVSLSADQKARLLRQIATESGGNERITQQISDVNSAAGHPAQGLLQFIPSTFAHWAMPGHNNILSGYDQIMAAINCLNHGGEGGWGNIGDGHGWDNGGVVDYMQKAWIAENNREYVINPQRASADELLRKAAEERAAYDPNSEIAKAISGMNMARQSNGSMLPNVTQISNAYTSSNPAVASSVQDNRPINISVELDGRTIANVSYPYQKMLQASDIRIQARKGGGAFA